MLGILIAAVGSACTELSDAIGKKKVMDGAASYYTFGFLTSLFSTLVLIGIGIWRNDLLFSLASLPTFIPRVFLEIAQAHVSVLAVVKADRSDYGPLRMITVPLLLLVDVSIGYSVSLTQILGMGLIIGAVLFLLTYEHFKTKGLWLILFTAVNAVVTLSLYKYNITHFNSVESEEAIIRLVLLLYFFVLAVLIFGENPLMFLRRKLFFAQSSVSGFGAAVGSFAYLFGPASVITIAFRAWSVLFSILSGRLYFKEKNFMLKLIMFLGILFGLLLLTKT